MQHAYVLFTVGRFMSANEINRFEHSMFPFLFAALMLTHNRLARLIPNGYAVIIHSDRAVCAY